MVKAIIIGNEPVHHYFATELRSKGDMVVSVKQNAYTDSAYQERCFAKLSPEKQREVLSDLKKNQVLAGCLKGMAVEKFGRLFSIEETFDQVETFSEAVAHLKKFHAEKVLIFGTFDLAPCRDWKVATYVLKLGEETTVYKLLSDTKGAVVAKCKPIVYSSDNLTDLLFRSAILGTTAMKNLSTPGKEESILPPGLQKMPTDVIHSFRTEREKRLKPSCLEFSERKQKEIVVKKPPAFIPLITKPFCLNVYYHGLFTEMPNPFAVENSLSMFVKHMEFLRAHFPILPLHEAANKQLDEAVATVSFDDGFASVYHLAYPLLKELDIPFTLFLNPAFLDGKDYSWEVKWKLIQHKGGFGQDHYPPRTFREHFEMDGLEKIDDLFQQLHEGACRGIYLTSEQVEEMAPLADMGNHTLSHFPLWRLSVEQQKREIIEGQNLVKQFSRYVPLLAPPYGGIDQGTEKIAEEQLVLISPQQMLQNSSHLWRAPFRTYDPEEWLAKLYSNNFESWIFGCTQATKCI